MNPGSTCTTFFAFDLKRVKLPKLTSGPPLDPYTYFATIKLKLLLGDPMQPISRQFILDTGSDVSVVPKRWFTQHSAILASLSKDEINMDTTAGEKTARGQMGRIPVRFPGTNKDFTFDFLVSATFRKDFGLLSLRDLLNNFHIRTAGPVKAYPGQKPLILGRLELFPRTT